MTFLHHYFLLVYIVAKPDSEATNLDARAAKSVCCIYMCDQCGRLMTTFCAYVSIKISSIYRGCFAKWLQSMQKVTWCQGNKFVALKYLWHNHTIVRKFFLHNGLRVDKGQQHIYTAMYYSQ